MVGAAIEKKTYLHITRRITTPMNTAMTQAHLLKADEDLAELG